MFYSSLLLVMRLQMTSRQQLIQKEQIQIKLLLNRIKYVNEQGIYQNYQNLIRNQQTYNYLHTDLQLGYVLGVKFNTTACVDKALILVQISTEIPMKVNLIIDNFFDQFQVYLEQINIEYFSILNMMLLLNQKKTFKVQVKKVIVYGNILVLPLKVWQHKC
ncbi:unnamed protein product [Paramecium sonneborni]|uniref:Coenzyme PQQ synthesis protein F-like C-terminal lobe domain-containing protein n=1 Tax=Paramecium sonneborni TaxID=65129 RepID=A0A8S1L4E8_9CILI|nr:unnamed protein product [Paramecium sonneborni]